MLLSLDKHPCFDVSARHTYGRVHLPVAPKCNIQCKFCDRKNDCIAESRPGVTSAILSPAQALAYLEGVMAERPNIAVVGIAGPGDPFANPDETLETLRLVRGRFPDILLCVASNGLAVHKYLNTLVELQVSHVTITINAIDARIGERIYAWVRDGVAIYRGTVGAKVLIDRQLAAIEGLKARGITVKVNTIVVPGVNDQHAPEVARAVATLGADVLNCVPLYPVADTEFADATEPSAAMMQEVRDAAARFLPQMRHCTRCRADAVGMLGETPGEATFAALANAAALPLHPRDARPYIAVSSREGMLINQHLGEARELLIYARDAGAVTLIERRPAPSSGEGDERWYVLSDVLHDCRALLVSRAGARPRCILERDGLRLVEMEGLILDGVQAVYEGRRIPAPPQPRRSCAEGGCAGGGQGC